MEAGLHGLADEGLGAHLHDGYFVLLLLPSLSRTQPLPSRHIKLILNLLHLLPPPRRRIPLRHLCPLSHRTSKVPLQLVHLIIRIPYQSLYFFNFRHLQSSRRFLPSPLISLPHSSDFLGVGTGSAPLPGGRVAGRGGALVGGSEGR